MSSRQPEQNSVFFNHVGSVLIYGGNFFQQNTQNIDRERLESLQDKTDNNLAVSEQRGANRVRKNIWWKDMKMRIIIGAAILIILAVAIAIAIFSIVKATYKS